MNIVWADSKVSELLSETLFSKDGFRFSISITPLLAEEFFANHGNGEILRERQLILEERPADYVQPLEGGSDWQTLAAAVHQWEPGTSVDSITALGASWEPDFVILDRKDPHPVLGGCVCFPSGWSLPEKVGRSLFTTHAPVPGLNDRLARRISAIVSCLDGKRCFQRANWGLTGSRALDQHPHRRIPKIGGATDPATVDLRIEWQALIGLPNDLILFGIRVFQVPLSRVRTTPPLGRLLAENLDAMPPEVAEYKRLGGCREMLLSYLRA
jgi:Haem-dependent oxidative N-demethylase, alpha subunit-like